MEVFYITAISFLFPVAVGVLAQPLALFFLAGYHVTVQRIEHGSRNSRFGFFFLSEKSQKTGTFPFLRFLARTFQRNGWHLSCYLFLYLFLFV